MKIIGNRRLSPHKGEAAFEKAAWLLELAIEFQKEKTRHIPKGVYHFRTFEEAEEMRNEI